MEILKDGKVVRIKLKLYTVDFPTGVIKKVYKYNIGKYIILLNKSQIISSDTSDDFALLVNIEFIPCGIVETHSTTVCWNGSRQVVVDWTANRVVTFTSLRRLHKAYPTPEVAQMLMLRQMTRLNRRLAQLQYAPGGIEAMAAKEHFDGLAGAITSSDSPTEH